MLWIPTAKEEGGTLRQQIDPFTPAVGEMRLRKRERINQFHAVEGQIQNYSRNNHSAVTYKNG